jgi:hypothetical protein
MIWPVAESITAVPGSRQLSGPGWHLTLERPIERVGRSSLDPRGGWRAVLGVRRGLKLLVTGYEGACSVRVEAWAGEPGDESDGVAVVGLRDGTLVVARVPLCGCGDRGCGNAGVQLRKPVTGDEFPALVELLRSLPWSDAGATRATVLRGEGLAALPVRASS